MFDSVVYPSRPNPTTPVKDHSLAANFSKWLPKNNIYKTSLQAVKAELEAERAAQKVEAA